MQRKWDGTASAFRNDGQYLLRVDFLDESTCIDRLSNRPPHPWEARAYCMRVLSEHGLDAVAGDLGYANSVSALCRTCRSMRHSERPQAALGKAIRALRDERELTQETLAERTGLSGQTLLGIETGAANPTWATVRDIAVALGVSISDLAKLAETYEGGGRRSRK
jgi:DNA-binding XRE family transcriptional regulator